MSGKRGPISFSEWLSANAGEMRGSKRNAFECGAQQRFRSEIQHLVYSAPYLQEIERLGYRAAGAWVARAKPIVLCPCCKRPLPAFEPGAPR